MNPDLLEMGNWREPGSPRPAPWTLMCRCPTSEWICPLSKPDMFLSSQLIANQQPVADLRASQASVSALLPLPRPCYPQFCIPTSICVNILTSASDGDVVFGRRGKGTNLHQRYRATARKLLIHMIPVRCGGKCLSPSCSES